MVVVLVSIRSNNLPIDVILPYFIDGTLPCGFTHECSLFCKYAKGAPIGCNPGSCVGSDCHIDSCTAMCHTHTASTTSHTHSESFGTPGQSAPAVSTGSTSRSPHGHSGTTGTTGTTVTICSTPASHTHTCSNLEPLNRTIRYIKRAGTSIELRKKSLPKDISSYTNILSPVNCWSINACLAGNRYHKAVPASCSSVGSTGGTTTHQHATGGCHTHVTTLSSHTHPAGGSAPGGCTTRGPGGGSLRRFVGIHSHPAAPVSITPATPTVVTCTDTHQHTNSNNDPLFVQLNIATKSSLALRVHGIPKNHLGVWLGTLATIPPGFQLSDGTNGTTDTRNNYIKEVCGVCQSPGCSGGNATHTHSSIAHTHVGTSSHSHASTGSSGSEVPAATPLGPGASCCGLTGACAHTHPFSVGGGGNAITGYSSTGSHGHGSQCNLPDSKEVAFIQKIYP